MRQLERRDEISVHEARVALDRLLAARVVPHPAAVLVGDASTIARQLGWAKAYDAENVALARRLDAVLMTLDARLRRSVTHLVTVLGPTEIR